MKKIYSLSFAAMLFSLVAGAQTFSTSSIGGNSRNSGNCGGVSDVNNDGLDDVLILDQSKNLFVAYQQNDGSFTTYSYGTVSNSSQWGMTVGDIDNDGWAEVLCGGNYDGVHVVDIDGFTSYTTTTYDWAYIFMQACNFADIDNDGWLDGFACHDDGHNALFHNNGDGTFDNGVGMIDMVFYPEVSGGNDNSGNYGTVWCDFDRDGDIDCLIAKCRQFINDPYDPRRTNILLVNDGNNNYSDQAPERGLVNLQQSWTADFGDVDNDGDFDCFITTHSGTLEIYENDGLGYFTDITAGSGLEVSGFFLQGKLADFDNDGWLDVIHAGGNHGYYHNNGNKTWTLVNNTFPYIDTMHSFQIGDLNHDGFLDVYATYGNNYVTPDNQHPNQLFLNNGNDNNWVAFDLEGTISNKMAIGAVVEIHGAFGTQVRDVRSGESYGITNTNHLHFGIGSATEIDYAVIYWPAGGIFVIDNPSINTFNEVIEQVCPSVQVTAAVVDGSLGCPVDLVATTNESNIIWSNGNTGANSSATQDGLYYAISYTSNGCAGQSNILDVDVVEDPAASIVYDGEIKVCQGTEVILTASPGAEYLWSNGSTESSISVTETGDYYVDVTICSTQRTETISIEVLDNPNPEATGTSISAPTSVDLVATGNNVFWYDAPDATVAIASGNTFTTPVITETTTFYVENVTATGGSATGGKTDFASDEGGNLGNGNFFLRFDAYEPFTLVSVDVRAQSAGQRTIQLISASGAVVQEAILNLPAGDQTVTLNFDVPVGNNHGLRCAQGSTPNLWRDKDLTMDTPFGYPYALGNSGAITGTTVSGADFDNYYYFFYNWQITTPQVECVSERIPVTVEVVVGVSESEELKGFTVYPNPADEVLNVTFESVNSGSAQVRILDMMGRVVLNQNIVNAAGKQNVQFNLNNLAKGIYQLEVKKGEEVLTGKVLVK